MDGTAMMQGVATVFIAQVYQIDLSFVQYLMVILTAVLASVGTTNMDFRSFDQNFEVNAMLYDVSLAEELAAHFEADVADSKPLTLARWKKRSIGKRMGESLARLMAPLL